MSRQDAIILASRTLAVLLSVWALTEVSYLPAGINSFVHYETLTPPSVSEMQYRLHSSLIALAFLVTRIVGYSLMARWLYKGGPEIEELLLPADESTATQS